jgi:hypothetical protein
MKIGTWIGELRTEVPAIRRESSFLAQPYKRLLEVLCLVLIVAVPLLQSFRGLDLTDTGFVATNQRLIFSDPAHVSYWFHLWLTNILGGLVDLVFGMWGLLPMKLAAAAIFWGTAIAAFKLFKSAMPRELIWVGIAVTIVFSYVDKINIVHYNNLSALSMAFGAWLIAEGCLTRQRGFLFIAGCVLGLSALIRVPNVLALGLIIVPLILDLVGIGTSDRLRPDVTGTLLYIAGAAAALAAGFLIMALLGHLHLYFASLRDLGASTGTEGSHYRTHLLLMRLVRDTGISMLLGGASIGAMMLASAPLSYVKSRALRVGLIAGSGALLCFGFFRGLRPHMVSSTAFRAFAGTGYLAAAAAALFLTSSGDRRLRIASAMAAAVVFALSFGSDTGIRVSTYAFLLLVPATLGVLSRMAKVGAPQGTRRMFTASIVIFVAILGARSVVGIARGVYRDTPHLVRTVAHPMLWGIFTSPARAEALEEALPVISSYAPPGSVLFAYDSLGLVHFATRTKPYLDNPWPALYSSDELDLMLRQREKTGILPTVVLAKHNPRSALWPLNQKPPYRPGPVVSFVERNGYRKTWENSALEIYVPRS